MDCIFCIRHHFFALAHFYVAVHIGPAFQASSPKTYRGQLSRWPFFCLFHAAALPPQVLSRYRVMHYLHDRDLRPASKQICQSPTCLKPDLPEERTPSLMHSLTEKVKFFREFLRSPKMIGSVIPTSSSVIDHLLQQINWQTTRLVVEYGPGMGTITKPILHNLAPDAQLIAIDMNPDFIAHLRQTIDDPRFIAVHGSAADIERILADHAPGQNADYIVSGLPFSTLPPGVDNAIMAATARAAGDHGAFLVYQYSRFVKKRLQKHFAALQQDFIWANIPPCFIFTASKPTTASPSGND